PGQAPGPRLVPGVRLGPDARLPSGARPAGGHTLLPKAASHRCTGGVRRNTATAAAASTDTAKPAANPYAPRTALTIRGEWAWAKVLITEMEAMVPATKNGQATGRRPAVHKPKPTSSAG